ncbi:hypothetical protein CXB51_021698 [Gossypium anomalum]|uniref:LIM zinc-binding domain-containing protein n=1 Tax=Gossypium anomalum TaxID=47600 RepID=A0A8J6CRW5_9ROSI|nr:hypothetical protein CXB51_021698 [Gossypium anomalum]
MSFTGTIDKCKACDKTVHVVDMLTLEGMSTYSSMDGVLYCKPHFEQLFKESGNFSKNFLTVPLNNQQTLKETHFDMETSSKFSSMFCGTQDKCASCEKTVYLLEKVTMEGECFHKSCFKCAHGGCHLTHSSYAALNGVLYCKHHFSQLFMEKGNYNHVLEAATHKRNNSAVSIEHVDNESEENPAIEENES